MNADYERGFSAGYAAAMRDAVRDISTDRSRPSTIQERMVVQPKRKMKRSAWHKYMKNSKNQITFKRGTRKGLLDMKTMARNYRRSNK